LGAAQARAKFEGGFYKRGSRNAAWASHPGRLGEKGIANVVKQLQVWHGGVENMHKIPVLEEGMTLNSIGQSLEDMQFAQLAEQTRTEIAVLFNIPPAYLGAKSGDSLTYATTESNQIQFAQMAVLPIADTISKALSSDPGLLPWNVMFAEFTLESLIRADAKTRAEVWKLYKDMGVVDEAYIAARENLPKPPTPKPQPAIPGLPPDPMQEPKMVEQQAKLRALNQ
jgi:HK97 family phage portal protein